MKKITVVFTVMCALAAYMTYPSAGEQRQTARETLSPMAMMQASPALAVESYEAI